MNSIWQENNAEEPYDLIVIGAGIVGMHTALFYKRAKPKARVCVVERGPYPIGASVRNAGFACFGSPSELLADIEAEGADAALNRVHLRWEGLKGLRSELGDQAIGLVEDGGYELFVPDTPLYTHCAESFDQLNELLAPLFDAAVFSWRDEIISQMGLKQVEHAAHIQFEASLDTGKMMRSLWNKVLAEGVEMRVNTEIISVDDSGTFAELQSPTGPLRCEQVVIATNAYAGDLVEDIDLVPGRGQVVLTTEISDLQIRGDHHLEEGYYYFRPYGNRVLLGGGRQLDKAAEETTKEGLSPLVQDKLEELLREVILPGKEFQIEKRWSGIMAFGSSKDPIVKRLNERVILAVRSGGMGVAIGYTLGKRAAELASS